MNLCAVVVTGGVLNPLTPVAGVATVVRSVRLLLGVPAVERVLVLTSAEQRAGVERSCSGLPVDVRDRRHALTWIRAHADQRVRTPSGDGPRMPGYADVVLLHDADRPLAPASVIGLVLAALVDGVDAVVPVLPLTDTVKLVDGDGLLCGTPDRSGLLVVQTPQAFRLDALRDVPPLDLAPLDLVAALAADNVAVHTVAGDPLAFPLRTAWDVELAELLLRADA